MKRYQIDSPDFIKNALFVEIPSFFKGPVLTLNNSSVDLKRGKGSVRDDTWMERKVVLKSQFYEYPWVEIDDKKYYPMGKLGSFEKIFVVLPIGLLAVGGAIGGGLGGLAAYTNSLLMLEYKDSNLRFVFSILTSGLAFLCWYLSAIMINSVVGR